MSAEWKSGGCGLRHLGKVGDARRASVEPMGDSVHWVTLWWSGCGLNPHDRYARSEAEAVAMAEAWVSGGAVPDDQRHAGAK